MSNGSPPAGWGYLEEYQSFIARTERDHPGFFVAFQEALRAQKEADEVPQTAVLTEVPTEEETLELFRRKYDLVPRHSLQPRDEATSTNSLVRMISKGTQTDVPLEASSSRPSIPTHNPLFDPHPIIKENFVRKTPPSKKRNHSPSRPSISTPPNVVPITPSPKSKLPSLLDLKVPPPSQINPSTLEFLRDTAEFGCWNCGDSSHRHPQCLSPPQLFCFGCGRKGFSKASCPKCIHTPL